MCSRVARVHIDTACGLTYLFSDTPWPTSFPRSWIAAEYSQRPTRIFSRHVAVTAAIEDAVPLALPLAAPPVAQGDLTLVGALLADRTCGLAYA
jgi:hypothetical protein